MTNATAQKTGFWAEVRDAARETPRMYFGTVLDLYRMFGHKRSELRHRVRESAADGFDVVTKSVAGHKRVFVIVKTKSGAPVIGVASTLRHGKKRREADAHHADQKTFEKVR